MPVRVVVAAVCVASIVAAAEEWPCFRGPTGLGYTTEKNLPHTWGGERAENVRWKAPLIGQGHASPIVRAGRVVVCTVNWPASVKEREKVKPDQHVLCYDAGTGALLWDTLVPPGPWLRNDFRSGPGGGYACPTPAADKERIYCVFGTAVIAALDFQGRVLWRKEITPYSFDVTIGTSPVVYKDTVVMFCAMAQAKDSCLRAYAALDGAVKWETPLPRTEFGHSTPLTIDVGGRTQLLCVASGGSTSAEALQSFDPANGTRLWWCEGQGDAASPAFDGARLYFDSGRGGIGTAVAANGTGDVTKSHIAWKSHDLAEGIGSPTIVGAHLYRIERTGEVVCSRLSDGAEISRTKLPGISTTWASPIADPDGTIFYANAGKSFVLKAGPEGTILAVNDLGDGNHASPAVAGGRMYLVGTKNVYCVEKKP